MDETVAIPLLPRLREQLAEACKGEDMHLYAVFDAARIKGLRVLLRELHIPATSLFSGTGAEQLLYHVAPYLAELTLDDTLFSWLRQDKRALEAGMFIVCPQTATELRSHLRRFFLVTDSQKRVVFLRFYDPRVLPPFLSASNEQEKRQFFGPMTMLMHRDLKDQEESSKPPLVRWLAPAAAPEAEIDERRPGGLRKFALRQEHDDAFARDCMERYEQRAEEYLRGQHSSRLTGQTSDQVRGYVRRAKALAPELGITAGRDVTLLAELLLLGSEERTKAILARRSVRERHAQLLVLREQFMTGGVR